MLFLKPDVTKKNRELFFLEGFVWSHQSITGLISRRQFVPKSQFLASRPLGCCSFQNILTNPIMSQINTLLLPYSISYYSSAFTINQFHNHDAEVYALQRLVLSKSTIKPFLTRSLYETVLLGSWPDSFRFLHLVFFGFCIFKNLVQYHVTRYLVIGF